MAERRRILLYGNSIILGSVRASLARSPEFELTSLSAPRPTQAELEAMAPDVILFDIENSHPEAAFALLEAGSDLLLLGISPDGNVVRQWSGHQHYQLTTDELTALMGAGSEVGSAQDGHLVKEPHGRAVRHRIGGTTTKGRV